MFIPEIGTKLVLTRPWSFSLYKELRNQKVWDMISAARPEETAQKETVVQNIRDEMNDVMRQNREDTLKYTEYLEKIHGLREREANAQKFTVLLPQNTHLTVDRIYIRKGSSDYSSITFYLTKTDYPALDQRGRKRFWAKLDEVNNMEFRLPD